MFCPHCGTEVVSHYKYCPNCGANAPNAPSPTEVAQAKETVKTPAPNESGKTVKEVVKESKKAAASAPAPAPAPEPVAAPAPAPAPVAAPAPAPAPTPAKPALDVKKIIKSPPKIVSLKESVDFKGAEAALDTEGLKTKAFSGVFSSAAAHEVRIDSLVKIYEPVHVVKAVYEGEFEVAKDFNLALDADTVKVALEGKVHEIKPVAGSGGMFGGSSTSLKLTGTETIKKRKEKGVYYDMKGVMKNNLEQSLKGKDRVKFDTSKQMPRCQILGTDFDASHLTDQVLTPDIIQRVQNANKMVGEMVTVEIETVYYPKYKAQVTNLKNNQQKYVIFSAVDKQVFNTETF